MQVASTASKLASPLKRKIPNSKGLAGTRVFSSYIWEEAGFMCLRSRKPSSHMTLVSMTTENIHTVFPASRMQPKRLVRGFQNRLHNGGISSLQSCYTKVKKKEKKKENLSSFWFCKAFSPHFFLRFAMN